MRAVLFWWHLTPAMCKHVWGRWYVFRNTPTWVLEEFTEAPQSMVEEEAPDDPQLWSFYDCARQELELRRRNQ